MKPTRQQLQRDMRGSEIDQLQKSLIRAGHSIVVEEVDQTLFGVSTHEAVTAFQGARGLPATGIVDDTTQSALTICCEEIKTEAQLHTLRGTVRDADGKPLAGDLVRIVDARLAGDRVLAETRTDACGRYAARYWASESHLPALRVRVLNGKGSELAASAVVFRPTRELVIDIVVGGGAWRGLPELDSILGTVSPLLEGGVGLGDLTKEQVQYLASRTRIDGAKLQLLVWAERRGCEHGLVTAALYGLARAGLPTSIPALLAQTTEARRAGLGRAIAMNAIAASVLKRIGEIERAFQEAAVRLALAPTDDHTLSFAPLLEAVGASSEVQRRFVSILFAHEGSGEKLWQSVATDPQLAPSAPRLKLSLQLGAIARLHAPMVKALIDRNIATPRDLVHFSSRDWRELVGVTGYPSDVPGDGAPEKAEAYAATLERTVAMLYPTPHLVARLAEDRDFISPELLSFFEKNPDFEMRDAHLDSYVAAGGALGGSVDAELARELSRMHRVFRLAPTHVEWRTLVANGFDSSARVVETGREQFLARVVPAIERERAEDIFDRARQIAATAALLYAQHAADLNSVGMTVLPSRRGVEG